MRKIGLAMMSGRSIIWINGKPFISPLLQPVARSLIIIVPLGLIWKEATGWFLLQPRALPSAPSCCYQQLYYVMFPCTYCCLVASSSAIVSLLLLLLNCTSCCRCGCCCTMPRYWFDLFSSIIVRNKSVTITKLMK